MLIAELITRNVILRQVVRRGLINGYPCGSALIRDNSVDPLQNANSRVIIQAGVRALQLFMRRRMTWLDEEHFNGWGCSECAWVFNPSGPLVGKTIEEMKQQYEKDRDREFMSHDCAAYPKKEQSNP